MPRFPFEEDLRFRFGAFHDLLRRYIYIGHEAPAEPAAPAKPRAPSRPAAGRPPRQRVSRRSLPRPPRRRVEETEVVRLWP